MGCTHADQVKENKNQGVLQPRQNKDNSNQAKEMAVLKEIQINNEEIHSVRLVVKESKPFRSSSKNQCSPCLGLYAKNEDKVIVSQKTWTSQQKKQEKSELAPSRKTSTIEIEDIKNAEVQLCKNELTTKKPKKFRASNLPPIFPLKSLQNTLEAK